MDILEIAGLGVLGAVLAAAIRPFRPDMALVVGAATGVLLMLAAVLKLTGVTDAFRTLMDTYGIESEFVAILLKIVGIAYAAQFGAQICADAGETAISGRVELCGRVMILAAALPAVAMALSSAAGLIGGLP